MRKILATVMVAFATLFAAPVMAADIPEYPDIEIPEVDYDLGDSFYLRGSAALNVHWAREVNHPDVCGSCGPSGSCGLCGSSDPSDPSGPCGLCDPCEGIRLRSDLSLRPRSNLPRT